MAEDTSGVWLRTRCACGWEVVGPEDEVVTATIDHGRHVHNMIGTREAVLAAAERLPAGETSPRAAP